MLIDPDAERMLEASRVRSAERLSGRESWTRWTNATVFLAVAVAFALTVPWQRSAPLAAYLLLIVAYAAASRIQFEIGSGYTVPTELFLIPMLFVLPAAIVPFVVASGFVLGSLPECVPRRAPRARMMTVSVGNAWYALGPAAVMVAAGEPRAAIREWPLLVALLAAQFGTDFVSSVVREWAAVGVRPRQLVEPLRWVFLIDTLLAPIGFLAAIVAVASLLPLLLPLPLLLLFRRFAGERKASLDGVLELSQAYRGTALLLGDVIEADDSYTGSHSRDVVSLTLEVADAMGLSPSDRRDAELTALLHDVGKIRIPAEILNKPGPLDPRERAIIKTHTIEGESLLETVGGMLARVGHIVRSCHERWDGVGYPDGLAEAEIPLIARIVCCCDAFNAMTTDRPYRRALPHAVAVAEIASGAGSQFDPTVATTLLAVVGTGDPAGVELQGDEPLRAVG